MAAVLGYGALFLLAILIGFAAGAGLHRAVFAHPLLDLDGDVQSLRVRVTEAKAQQDGA
ncbi:MAG TPA: hypothetical protein VG983_02115 [Caulobacterales bacterium]|jgi:hypothetical protein|nr:hypothetical protein [Caulobacterales bacterium]